MPRGIKKIEEVVTPTVISPTENVPQGTVEAKPVTKKVERVRKYSDTKDHKGEGEPLCFNCGHRQDMHYIERRRVEQRVGQNFLKEQITYEVMHRENDYSGARPCNHACLCTQYE